MKHDVKLAAKTGIFLLLALPLLAPGAQAQPTVTQISLGQYHSLFLKSDGSLWAMGYNFVGQLGDGTHTDSAIPEQIVASGVTSIAAGQYHSLFVKSDGSLWAMGWNSSGQLGDGTHTDSSVPEEIVASNVVAVAGGGGHSLFLESDGSLWAMGGNSDGQLGDGTLNDSSVPEKITVSGTGSITAIAAGSAHSLFLRRRGLVTELWAMGANEYGQLGDGTFVNRSSPVKIFSAMPSTGTPPTAIAAGYVHSLFIKSGGSLWVMGATPTGQVGDDTYTSNSTPTQIVPSGVIAIAGGRGDSLFAKSDGSLWGIGDDTSGQLGDPNLFGGNTANPDEILSSGVTTVACGMFFSLFTKSDGTLWAMGDDSSGQLGDRHAPHDVTVPELILLGPPPALGISTYSNQPVLLFPLTGTNYLLKTTTNLTSGVWTTVTNGIPFIGVQIPNAPSNAFFKLQ